MGLNLSLQQLRYFTAVARRQHIGAAARDLNMTQSPLSRQIAAIEAELGSPLFLRVGRRVRLLPAGQALLEEAERLLSAFERFEGKARAIASGDGGVLRIGYVAAALHAAPLPEALAHIAAAAPDLEIRLRPMRSHEQFQALEAAAIDVAIAHGPPPQGLAHGHRFHVEPFRLIGPAVWLEVAAERWDSLSERPFIGLPADAFPLARAVLAAGCERAGFRMQVRHEAEDVLAALAMARAGLGLAIVQESLAGGVASVALPASFEPRVELWAAARQDAGAAGRRLLNALIAPTDKDAAP